MKEVNLLSKLKKKKKLIFKKIKRLNIRKLFSKKNLPFSFYSLKFCQPNPKILATESIGEVIFGDQIENSLYNVNYFSFYLLFFKKS